MDCKQNVPQPPQPAPPPPLPPRRRQQQHQQQQHQQQHRIWLSCLLDTVAERLLYEAATNRKKLALVYQLYCHYKPKIRTTDRLIDGRVEVRAKEAEIIGLLSGAFGWELERIERSLLLCRRRREDSDPLF